MNGNKRTCYSRALEVDLGVTIRRYQQRVTPDSDADLCKRSCPLYPPKADMCGAAGDVCFGPIADIDGARINTGLMQHDPLLIRPVQQASLTLPIFVTLKMEKVAEHPTYLP